MSLAAPQDCRPYGTELDLASAFTVVGQAAREAALHCFNAQYRAAAGSANPSSAS
ncbi:MULTISPECIES: hypothetical protein [unclassified Streptomyces]|uniref:hypothetical protein n=1 Tax=unclassified Streptomyces TaxID=2593676 RepID=UPI001331B285|nr:hypothetical protein [Streptomyces sp. 3211]